DNNNYTGTFAWFDIPNLAAGDYPLTFYANDADNPADVDSARVTIHVTDYNYKPNLIFFIPFTVCIGQDCSMDLDEGETAQFQFYSGDLDGISPLMVGWRYSIDIDTIYDTLTYVPPIAVDTSIVHDTTYLPLPNHMEVNDLGNDTADFIFSPDYTQAGTYRVFLMALDAADTTLYQVTHFTFSVHNVPMSPLLDPIGDRTLTEGDTLDVLIHGYDPDGGAVTIYAQGLPPGATFTIVQPNTATNRFYYNPGYSAAGSYTTLFYVRENAFPYEADSEYVDITVLDAGPQAPILTTTPSGTQTLTLGDSLKVWIQAIDPDGGPPTLSVIGDPEVPYSSVFADSGNGRGSFRYGPLPLHADSSWTVRFIASDGALADTVTMEINVISYVHGDADGDGIVNISDAIYIIAYIFAGGAAPVPYDAGDADGSGTVNISDVSYLIQYIFNNGPPPVQ
ncbi:MAG: dockerin type I domain-containing protein, partial [bacterium]